MNRITPEQVVAAYRSLDYEPQRGGFGDPCGPGSSCCALVAVFVEKHGEDEWNRPRRLMEAGGTSGERLMFGLDLPAGYVQGFIDGFDASAEEFGVPPESEEDKLGFRDGCAAWQAVVAAGLAK